MELDYKEIGKRVKIARIRADLTQEALAEKAGLSITHMSNIENGHSKLSLPMAVALANVLSVSVDEFLCDSVIHSKEVFSHEVQMLLEDCDDYEVRILTDLLKAAKDTIRRDMKLKQQEWGCRTIKYFLLGGSPALCPNGGEIGCDFAPIPYKHSSFPDIPFGMPDFKLFCFQPLKSMLSLMKKDDSPFFRSESCNEAY